MSDGSEGSKGSEDSDDNQQAATFTSGDDDGDREHWPSRTSFYLAAIGSAVGFGNIWRFPALAKDYGGGAFFIPYIMALVLVGYPILLLEISMGQVYQLGNVGVFGHFHARYRGVGHMSSLAAFMLVVYYSMLLSWITNAFFDSFGDDDPWAQEGVTGQEAIDYFFNEIIGMSTLTETQLPTRIVWVNVAYAALNWFLVWVSLAGGLSGTGYLVYFTMGLPVILLVIFFFKSIKLTGASAGIQSYIGEWDMDVLTDQPDVWSQAVSQIFYSLGTCMGTMTAYGSACPPGEPAAENCMVISAANSTFSFVSGFAVFASLGHLSFLEGVPVDDLAYSGLALTFGTWPVVFGTFPGGEHWVRLLFLDLYLLGYCSAFSILESPNIVFMDYSKKREMGWEKWQVTGVLCFVAWLISFMYATDAGLSFLDTTDFYVNFILLLVGLIETFGAGWVFKIEDQVEKFGMGVVVCYICANFLSTFIACIIWFVTSMESKIVVGFLVMFGGYFAGVGLTYFWMGEVAARTGEPVKDLMKELAFGNIEQLRMDLSAKIGYLPFIWAFMIKQLIPHILMVLWINLCFSENDEGEMVFGNFLGLPFWPYQLYGIGMVVSTFTLFLIGAIMPDLYEGFDLGVDKRAAAAKDVEDEDDNDDEEQEVVDVEDVEKIEGEKTGEAVEKE